MIPPGSARHDGAGGHRSPFTGSDVCAAAALPLAPGGRTVWFDQDVWDFGDVAGLAAYLNLCDTRLDFTAITDRRWRLVAKEYIYARLAPADPVVAVLPGAYRVPLTLASCGNRLAEAANWLNWLTRQQIASLEEITQDHCDRFLIERGRRKDTSGIVIGTLEDASLRLPAAVVIELAGYSELFTADRYADGFSPWRGRTSSQVAGIRHGGENKTPPLDQRVLQPLLAAAFYLTETLGPHLADLRHRVRQDRLARHGLRPAWATLKELHSVLGRHIDTGEPLHSLGNAHIQARLTKGWAPGDPLLPVSFTALANAAGARRPGPGVVADARPAVLAALDRVGAAKPWGRAAAEVAAADDTAVIPWTTPLDTAEICDLTSLVRTACLIITAMITGMRRCELMELRIGCRRSTVTGPGRVRYRLAGKLIKGQGLGGLDDEWVVVEEADRAVALAEQLCDDTTADAAVFGSFAFDSPYAMFRDWVNGPAGQRLGLTPIPEGRVNLRMMRRALAQEIAYRPGGLLAARVALKHVSAATTEGYSSRPGGAQAKLLAEIGEFETERNLSLVAEEYRNYQNGIMPAGPGARELAAFFDSVEGKLPAGPPSVAGSDQHLLNLLSKRAKILHIGAANFCWFSDPSRALCLILAGTPSADAPLISMCDSARCPQATHHQRHRAVWAGTVSDGTVFIGQLGRTRKTERARLQGEIDRAQRVVDAIDTGPADNTGLAGQAEGE
jgi:integrase